MTDLSHKKYDLVKNNKLVFFVFSVLVLAVVQSFIQIIFSDTPASPLLSNLRLALYFIITLFCSLLAFTIGSKCLDRSDKRVLIFAYVFLLAGTAVFVISEFVKNTGLASLLFSTGNVYFYFMHVFFIIRHQRKESVLDAGKMKSLFTKFIIFLAIFTGLITGLYFILRNSEVLAKVAFIYFIASCVIYAVIIITALIKAYGTFHIDFFPDLNTVFIMVGYTSFLFCEIFTVYGEFVKQQVFYAKLMTVPYYTAGFLFLALSGYLFKKLREN